MWLKSWPLHGFACFYNQTQRCYHCFCPKCDKIIHLHCPAVTYEAINYLTFTRTWCTHVFNHSVQRLNFSYPQFLCCWFKFDWNLTVLLAQIFRDVPSSAAGSTNLQLNLSRRKSTDSKAPSCSERPLTLFHTPTHSQKGELNNLICSIHIIVTIFSHP